MRILKKMKITGLIMVGQGEFAPHEYRGPPDYEHWLACWEVFQTAMIMLNACSPPYLLAYAAHIGHYAKRYGARCCSPSTRWRPGSAVKRWSGAGGKPTRTWKRPLSGRPHPFDPARPWDYIFKMATDGGPSEAKYWHINVEEPCVLIIAGRYSTVEFLDGDAQVCANAASHVATHGTPGFVVADSGGSGSNRQAHFYRLRPAQQPPPKRQATLDRAPKPQQTAHPDKKRQGVAIEKDGKYTTNKMGNSLCHGFNAGTCVSKKGNHLCPQNAAWRHNCSLCLSSSHGAKTCTTGKTVQKLSTK